MGNGPFIDGLPNLKMVIFHGYVSHNQMVDDLVSPNDPNSSVSEWHPQFQLFISTILSFPSRTPVLEASKRRGGRRRWRKGMPLRFWGCGVEFLHIITGWWFGVWNMAFIFPFHIWDNSSHWLIFFKMVKTYTPPTSHNCSTLFFGSERDRFIFLRELGWPHDNVDITQWNCFC